MDFGADLCGPGKVSQSFCVSVLIYVMKIIVKKYLTFRTAVRTTELTSLDWLEQCLAHSEPYKVSDERF